LTLGSLISCTNYSVSRVQTVPPILISLATLSTGGHLLVYRGTNPEIFFAGYKLYIGSTANEARNPEVLSSGIDCINRSLLPNLPIEYSIEIYTSVGLTQVATGENASRVCKFSTSLVSGKYIPYELSCYLSNREVRAYNTPPHLMHLLFLNFFINPYFRSKKM